MRYLLVSQPAQTRQDVARLLGVHRHAVSRWRALSAAGGLDALLATDLSLGQPVSLAPPVLASLAQARRRPGGFASSEALRQWGRRTGGVEVPDETRYPLVRTRFHPGRKVARPRHTQTP